MNPITLSINPTYLCNFRCKFCYLTPEQLADKKRISVKWLDELLMQVEEHTTIKHIDLYGGEIALLPEDYFYPMKAAIRRYYKKPINIITNLSRIPSFFLDDDIQLSVSYDFDCRERNFEVYRCMASIQKDLHVLILASECVIKKDVDEMIQWLNGLTNIKSVEIKPYSTNQANQFNVTHRQFEEFVKKWIKSPVEKKFDFTNQRMILRSLTKNYNAFSDDHVYITPNGRFAVLDFDQNDHEKFTELNTFADYIEWTKREKELVLSNPICKDCPYVGHCLTEHYRWVKDLDNSCNGYRHLLDWYDGRVED